MYLSVCPTLAQARVKGNRTQQKLASSMHGMQKGLTHDLYVDRCLLLIRIFYIASRYTHLFSRTVFSYREVPYCNHYHHKALNDLCLRARGKDILLDEALKLYQEGSKLAAQCKEHLEGVEKELQILNPDK